MERIPMQKHILLSLLLWATLSVSLPAFTIETSTPLLLSERYLMATYQGTFGGDRSEHDLGIAIFNGDFPLLIHATNQEVSLYTGSPQFFPLFVSLGVTNQIGYIDAYRSSTPLALLSVGYRFNLFDVQELYHEGLFASWGWRHNHLSGGLSYHADEQKVIGNVGASFEHGAISLGASAEHVAVGFTIRTGSSWSLSTSVGLDVDGTVELSIGAGISRRDYPANALFEDDWDMLIAHRGSLVHAPENTMAAFTWALDQPQYIGIETDIRQSADGNFVLVHDPMLLRYDHGWNQVDEMTSEELKRLDMGSWFDDAFAGQRVLDLQELAQIANRHPHTYWLLEIKDTDWTEDDTLRFLSVIANNFLHPEKVVFYVVTHDMLPILKGVTGRPVGLQLDSVKSMLFYSDHLLPLLEDELEKHLDHADFFTILSTKYDRQDEMKALSERFDIPVLYWNFQDTMFGYIPKSRKQFPLGMPTIEKGPLIRSDYLD